MQNILFSNSVIECPLGWIDGRSAGLGCLYFTTDQKRTWQDSKTLCATMHDSHLVEIFNDNQQSFINQEASKIGSYYWWIGLTDDAVEGIWRWDHV